MPRSDLPRRLQSFYTEFVIHGSLLGIAEDLESSVQLLKARVGGVLECRVGVPVGMQQSCRGGFST